MYILDPSLDEDASNALIGKIDDLMTKQGVEVEKTEPWGKRRLAYAIKGHREGNYILSYLKAPPTVISDMERRLRVLDGVLRFLTVRMDEQQAKLERRKTRRGEKGVARRKRKAERVAAGAEAAAKRPAPPKAPDVAPEKAPVEAPGADSAETAAPASPSDDTAE